MIRYNTSDLATVERDNLGHITKIVSIDGRSSNALKQPSGHDIVEASLSIVLYDFNNIVEAQFHQRSLTEIKLWVVRGKDYTERDEAYLGSYSYGETRNNYYCGITDDLDRRSEEHNATFIKTMEADTFEGAKELEKALDRVGFDAGDHVGNGTEKSVFIYMYKKIPGVTKE